MKYNLLKFKFDSKNLKRVVNNLLSLKEGLLQAVPQKSINDNLLIATWNLRDFDSNKFGHGPRLEESFFYIGEILSAFDLIAVQEVGEDLAPLEKLLYTMGNNWEYIVTDVTEGDSGNDERMAFVYDRNRVWFENMAGEVVLPKNVLIQGNVQFARSPFLVSFQSGWLKFKLCTVHIYYGKDTGTQLQRRIEEIKGIVGFLKTRADKYHENFILLGDFNIISPQHQTMEALANNGFEIPDKIKEKPVATNMYKTMHYDQIAYREKENEIRFGDRENSAGVFDYYQYVFKENDYKIYMEYFKPDNVDKNKDGQKTDEEFRDYYFSKWRTWQMSDHLPLWVELKVDFSKEYLERIVK
jgi:exonuclease III